MRLGAAPTGVVVEWQLAGWQPKQGFSWVLGYDQAFGSPTRPTHMYLIMPRHLDPELGLAVRSGVWIPNRGYIQVFESKPVPHTGVWSPESPTRATHCCLETQTGDWASCHCGALMGFLWRRGLKTYQNVSFRTALAHSSEHTSCFFGWTIHIDAG